MREERSLDEVHVDELLWRVLSLHVHELHLEAGLAPLARRDGEEDAHELEYVRASAPVVQSLLYDIISDEQIMLFESNLMLSFRYNAFLVPGAGRRMFNGFAAHNRRGITVSFRVAPLD